MVEKLLPAIRRGIILVLVWACALFFCVQASQIISDHDRKAAEVAELEKQYEAKVDEYVGLLAEGEEIISSPKKQVGILRENYGYTLPDETPIVIVTEQSGTK